MYYIQICILSALCGSIGKDAFLFEHNTTR